MAYTPKTILIVNLILLSLSQSLLAAPGIELFKLADRQTQEQDLVGAELSYQQLISANSNLQEYAHYFYALNLKKQKRSAEAKVQFKKILELSPNFKLLVESNFELAQFAIEEKNFIAARALLLPFEKRLRHEEKYPEIVLSLARAERGLGKVNNFCKWIKILYTHYPEVSEISSWGLKLKDNILDGQATQCLSSPEEQNKRIKNLQWAGMSEEALREINEIAEAKVLDALELDKLRVQYFLHEGDVTKALDILLANYQERKNHFGYLMTLASASARAGEVPAAVGSYYAAYRLGGKSKLAKQALYQAAFLSYQFQDYDGAARKFQEFMRIFPSSGLATDAKWHLAWIRYLRGDFEGAYKSFVELKTTSVKKKKRQTFSTDRLNYWMAMSLLKQNRLEEAKFIFEGLAQDTLLGYYSIAAQFRLKKIEPLMPKAIRRSVTDSIRHVARINSQAILPSDEYLISEVLSLEPVESEESIVVSALKTDFNTERAGGGDSEIVVTNEEESPTEGGAAAAVASGKELEESKSPFASPILVKRFERARDLISLGLQDWAKWDLFDIEKKTSNREYLRSLMTEYEKIEVFQRSSYIGQTTFGALRAKAGMDKTGRPLWEHTYPKAYARYVQKFSKQFEIPMELVWGIMRAESQYKKDVISPVGALGLMQVMPGTGVKIANMIGEAQFHPKKLLEPETGIKIGSRYLARLMKKFENSVPLVAASYNAGPHRVKSWLASFGDLEMDEFIEHIPFLETRNYVKRVVSNFQIYNGLYGKKSDAVASLADPNQVKINEPLVMRETWEDN